MGQSKFVSKGPAFGVLVMDCSEEDVEKIN
jgi:hypothetical protein